MKDCMLYLKGSSIYDSFPLAVLQCNFLKGKTVKTFYLSRKTMPADVCHQMLLNVFTTWNYGSKLWSKIEAQEP